MRRLIARYREITHDERGANAVLIVFLIIPMLGFGALALDISAQHADHTQLQQGADAASLAIAQACGRNEATCGATATATGAPYVVGNGGIPVEGGIEDISIDYTNDTVHVVASADFPHFLASLIDGAGESTLVRVGSTAKWEAGASATVVPFAIGECTVPTSGSSSPSFIPIDRSTCGGAEPGGFGWLDDGTTSCIKDVTLGDFTTITTGDTGKCDLTTAELSAAAAQIGCSLGSIPRAYRTTAEKLFYCFIGRTILVPVYSLAADCDVTPPAGKAYCITKFAAFEVYGMKVKLTTGDKVDACKPGYTCHLPSSWGSLGFEGRFISYITADDSWMLGPQEPAIRLVG